MSRRTNRVWNSFSMSDETEQIAKCNICKASMIYKTTVSNLKKHMIRKHPMVQLLFDDKADLGSVASTSSCHTEIDSKINSKAQTIMSSFIQKKITTVLKKKIDEALLMLFIDFQPFSVAQDVGFRQYTKALNPEYEIPSRQVISRTLMRSFYEECLLTCKETIKDIKAVSLTTDCWTLINNESYMGVTIHFIDEDFKLRTMLLKCACQPELNSISEKWGIKKKIVLTVSDNAANITSAIKNGTSSTFFGCSAHNLNLIVRDALDVQPEIAQIMGKVKTIVAYFKQSCKATTKLIAFQDNLFIKNPKKLLQDVVKRWNSTFYMFERFLELEGAVRSAVALLDTALSQVTLDEWQVLKELRIILEPFEDATRTINDQGYLVSSLVIVITGGLLDVCQELLKTLAATTFLDLVLKDYHSKMKMAKKNIISELADKIQERMNEEVTSGQLDS
nr:unnamed protein product [Callosobruchus analis]